MCFEVFMEVNVKATLIWAVGCVKRTPEFELSCCSYLNLSSRYSSFLSIRIYILGRAILSKNTGCASDKVTVLT
jgi:hypothetical protein